MSAEQLWRRYAACRRAAGRDHRFLRRAAALMRQTQLARAGVAGQVPVILA